MTTNSPNPVDGDVQALIAYCQAEIERFKRCVAEYPDAPVLRRDLKLYEIALAALTAERCGSLLQAVNPKTGSVNIFYRSRGIESIDPEEIAEWEMQEVEQLYTIPPAQILRPVELPDEREWHEDDDAEDDSYNCGWNNGIKACAESLRQQGYEVKND